MVRVVAFVNKNSGKNKKDQRNIYRLEKFLGDEGIVFATESFEEMRDIAKTLYAKFNPNIIISHGGDSTHCGVVAETSLNWPEEIARPSYALIHGGTWGVLTKQCKVKKPKAYLEDIIRGREDRLFHQEIDLMKVADDRGIESYGFSFGVGTPVTLLEKIYKKKKWKMTKVALVTANVLFKGKHYNDFAEVLDLKVNAGLNGDCKDYCGEYIGLMAQTIESVGKFIKPLNMFYKAQKKSGYFHVRGGSIKAVEDLWAYGLALAYGKELPLSVMPTDVQTNSLYIYSAIPLKYTINGDLVYYKNGKSIPFEANEIHATHGLTFDLIQSR